MIFLLSVILFIFSFKKNLFWLALPVGIFFDFWDQKQMGFSGLKILFFFFLFWMIFGEPGRRELKH